MADMGCLQKGPVVLDAMDFDTWWRYKPSFKKGTSLTKEEASQKLGIRLLRRLINAGVLIESDEAPGTIRSVDPSRVEEYDPKGASMVTLEDLQSPTVKKILGTKAANASMQTVEFIEAGSGREGITPPSRPELRDIAAYNRLKTAKILLDLTSEEWPMFIACVKSVDWDNGTGVYRLGLRSLTADGYKKSDVVALINRFGYTYEVSFSDIKVPKWWQEFVPDTIKGQ